MQLIDLKQQQSFITVIFRKKKIKIFSKYLDNNLYHLEFYPKIFKTPVPNKDIKEFSELQDWGKCNSYRLILLCWHSRRIQDFLKNINRVSTEWWPYNDLFNILLRAGSSSSHRHINYYPFACVRVVTLWEW